MFDIGRKNTKAVQHDDKRMNIYAEIYFVIAMWGMEFAINMGGPTIDGYLDWLKKHNNQSPLYLEKNIIS